MKLYRYYNTDPGGVLRCEEIEAKKTPKGYTYNHASERQSYGRGYDMVLATDLGRPPYRGHGELFLLERDDERAGKLMLEKLMYARAREITEAERIVNLFNRLIRALGGEAAWPVFEGEDKP